MKIPVSVFVLYHQNLAEGSKIYSEIYKLLCRDSKNVNTDGLDIPVFYRTNEDDGYINEIDESHSEMTAVLLLIDEHMFASQPWRDYVEKIRIKSVTNKNIKIFPVGLYKYAFEFNHQLGFKQFINLNSTSVLQNWEEFQTRLYDCLIRFIEKKDTQKINVFISHSKRDYDRLGEKTAIELRDYLRKESKIDSFFDVNDIADGARFDEQIEQGIEKSILLILFTNSYSSREWCRREVLWAKEKQIPATVVFLVNGDINRIFPYIGNVPSTVYNGDWRPVINLLLRTALDQFNSRRLLESMIGKEKKTQILPFAPEAYSFSYFNHKTVNVLYPEPPLGNEEMEVLKKIKSNIKFYTPMQYQTKDIDLKDKNIAISVSDTEDYRTLGIGKEMQDDLTMEISRHILKAKGKITYGGDLRKNGYTELFKEFSYQYGQHEKEKSSCTYITNFMAWPIHTQLTLENENEYRHARVELVKVMAPETDLEDIDEKVYLEPDSSKNRYVWDGALRKMREEMCNQSDARILVGGRTHGYTGIVSGVLEEFLLSLHKEQPIYLVGGFGGITGLITQLIEKKVSKNIFEKEANKAPYYKDLLNYYHERNILIPYQIPDTLNINDLRNGLSETENKTLFHSTNIIEIVSLILKGLKNTLGDGGK